MTYPEFQALCRRLKAADPHSPVSTGGAAPARAMQTLFTNDEMLDSGAIFDPDRPDLFRYVLWRIWDETKPAVNFLMLNPSTADQTANDPTVTRCIGYAKAWGFGRLYVTNLFALRATDPKKLRQDKDVTGPENDHQILQDKDVTGPENDHQILEIADQCEMVVAAWGRHGSLGGRGTIVYNLMQDAMLDQKLHVLGFTKTGEPLHPLYLKQALRPVPWKPDETHHKHVTRL